MINPNEFFSVAYTDMGGKADISANDLFAAADSLYVRWRDNLIEQWATAVYDKHGLTLTRYADKLLEMVKQRDETYYVSAYTSDIWVDDEDLAIGLAHMVAVIRWISNVRAERVQETLPATADDAQRWLDEYGFAPVRTGQMSLFLNV